MSPQDLWAWGEFLHGLAAMFGAFACLMLVWALPDVIRSARGFNDYDAGS